MTVGLFESCDWRPGQQEVLENAVFDNIDRLRLHAFVIVEIVAIQICSRNLFHCGIVDNRKKRWKHRFADLFCECLPFVFAFCR